MEEVLFSLYYIIRDKVTFLTLQLADLARTRILEVQETKPPN